MDEKKKYYLKPGESIVNKKLPNGTLKAPKDKFLEVDKKFFPVIGKSFDFLIAKGRMVDGESRDKILADAAKKEEAAKAAEKSEKRKALEKEAAELGLEFDDKTAQKDLAAMIEEAKKGGGK